MDDKEFRGKAPKDFICPFRSNILCSMWINEWYKEDECPNCGWHPEEEARRKAQIRQMVKEGKPVSGWWDFGRRKTDV